MPVGTKVGLAPGDIVFDIAPNFGPMSVVVTGQTAGWIKTPHGTKVGLDTGHIVLQGIQLPPQGAQPPPQFSYHVYCDQTVASPI